VALFGATLTPEEQERFDSGIREFHDLAKDMARVRASSDLGESEESLLDVLALHATDEETFVADFITFFIGGFHTTANTIIWTLYNLACHPEYQELIYRELHAAAAGASTEEFCERDGASALLDWAASSKTLNAVVSEVLRLERIGGFAGRINTAGAVTIAGTTFPAGTNFLLAIGPCCHHAGDYPDPLKFRPERFGGACPAGAAAPPGGKTSCSYVFGFGERRCPGQMYGVTQTTQFVAQLVYAAAVGLANPADASSIERDMSLVPTPKNDLVLTFTLR
jgi:cytochrome P450 family 20 subfamily A